MRRFSVLALAAVLVSTILASCAPTTPAGPTPQEQFCTFWDKVADDAPSPDNAVLVKDQVVAKAASTAVTGQQCTDSSAKVALSGATLAEGTEVPTEQNNLSSKPVAAITGDQVSAGEPVLDNVSVQTISADIGVNGINVRGNVNVRLSGVTSTIGFTGTLSNLDNWSVGLSSAGLTIPGVTTSPVVFSGTLKMANGVPSLSLTASASSVKIGDISVTGASIKLDASPATGVTAAVQGSLKIGPSTASGAVNVSFDKAGTLVAAKANISAHLVGTQTGGKKIDLTGTVKLEGNSHETAISFSANGIVGDLLVNAANGSLTLATNKATFVGVLDVAQGPNTVRFDGSIVWDGITAYTPFLNLQAAGEISGTLNDGQAVSVAGSLNTTIVGGQVHTEVTGNFKIGTLKASGSAVVDTNGASTTLNVDADLVDAGFGAHLAGVVVITDGLTELVSLDAAVNGTVQLGDVTLTGANLHIGTTYGNPLDLSFSGGLIVGSNANLNGSLKASFGPNGTLLSLNGQLNGSLNLGSWALLNFGGSVVAGPDQVVISGTGGILMNSFPLGINFSGTFVSSLTNPSWSLTGSGNVRILGLNLASARLSLSQGAGMKATHAGFYLSIIGIPTYLEADFYLQPSGGCSQVNLTGGSFLARPLAKLILPGIVGCPVN